MRECGICTACCTILGVKELEKSYGTKCVHECGKCAIYATRPQSCRDFSCMWLLKKGRLRNMDRPDRLGVMFANLHCDGLADGEYVVAGEVWKGALEQPEIKDRIGRFVRNGIVVSLMRHGAREGKVIGPLAKVKRIAHKIVVGGTYAV